MKKFKASNRHIVLATILGNTIEWYEFGLYAYLAPVISQLFFPDTYSTIKAVINVFFIFALGFISRVLGGIVFGYIGDKYGRKNALISSILLIIFPTFMIGLLPTFSQIGISAAILLALFRIMQAFPVGGEFPGTICFLMESVPSNQRGFYGSFAFFGAQCGILFNIVECSLMEHFLTKEQILLWGWRVSYFFGGCIGLFALLLRYNLNETPIFKTLEHRHHVQKTPFHQAIVNDKWKMFIGFLISALPLGGFYMIFVFSTFFLEEYYVVSKLEGLIINGVFLLISTILLPVLGRLGDLYGNRKTLIITGFCVCLFSLPYHFMIIKGHLILALFFQLLMVIAITYHFSNLSKILSSFFPTPVRFTCLGLSYNLSNVVFAGILPYLALVIDKGSSSHISLLIVTIVIALTSTVAFFLLKEKKGELLA